MSHVVFAAPSIRRYHLLERFDRELTARGHRVTVLCFDSVDFTFWSAQGLAATRVRAEAPTTTRAPLSEFAETDCQLAGQPPSGRRLARKRRRLARMLPGLTRFFEEQVPDLVFFHQERRGIHRLVQFVAAECGSRTLWTGEGLLPHTMQISSEGIDADASVCRRTGTDFRDIGVDEPLLNAALASLIARNAPAPLPRRDLVRPPLTTRIRDAFRSWSAGRGDGFFAALSAWQAALPTAAPPLDNSPSMPEGPFVAVLLQDEGEDRVRLDAPDSPEPTELVRSVRTAVESLDPGMPLVAILPRGPISPERLAALQKLDGVLLRTSDCSVEACLMSAAVVTINAPGATAALLAGTPVLHLGRALYGLPGVAIPTRTRSLAAALTAALQAEEAGDAGLLQAHYLSWTLAHGHVWCSVEQPDHNGLNGLVLATERRLAGEALFEDRLQYQAGPAWPLTAQQHS